MTSVVPRPHADSGMVREGPSTMFNCSFSLNLCKTADIQPSVIYHQYIDSEWDTSCNNSPCCVTLSSRQPLVLVLCSLQKGSRTSSIRCLVADEERSDEATHRQESQGDHFPEHMGFSDFSLTFPAGKAKIHQYTV